MRPQAREVLKYQLDQTAASELSRADRRRLLATAPKDIVESAAELVRIDREKEEAAMALQEEAFQCTPFHVAVREQREKYGLSVRDLALRLGKNKAWIEKLEAGTVLPKGATLARLMGMLKALGYYRPWLAEQTRDVRAEPDEPAPTMREVAPPPEPAPAPVPAEPEPAPAFAPELLRLRTEASVEKAVVAQLLGVTDQAVHWWETGANVPVRDHYNQLIALFPELERATLPPTRAIPKPLAGQGQERGTYKPRTFKVPPARHAPPTPAPKAPMTMTRPVAVPPPAPHATPERAGVLRLVISWIVRLRTIRSAASYADLRSILEEAEREGITIGELRAVLEAL